MSALTDAIQQYHTHFFDIELEDGDDPARVRAEMSRDAKKMGYVLEWFPRDGNHVHIWIREVCLTGEDKTTASAYHKRTYTSKRIVQP